MEFYLIWVFHHLNLMDGARGFSYNYDARLDMRMNQEASLDAHYIVNHYSYEQLVEILYKYADEKICKTDCSKN